MIEAEYKARLMDADAVRKKLTERAVTEVVSYHDVYFDDPGESLTATGRELRLRTIHSDDGSTRHLLTFKDPAVESGSGSKPEYETDVEQRDMMEQIITRLGYQRLISFTKKCENHRFTAAGRDMLATIVTIPEIDGTFLELETHIDTTDDLDNALADLRIVLAAVGVSPDQLTTELYTDAVAASRRKGQ
ncbi:class IV adenylate cyclase [Nocardia terpenica]|uniref:Class IV adenylate cyclase n=1 Tax=Nocardia terpenica TaxID=455432 RepID=A0A291RWY1_9NOCA|nr:class IV adenylate cyclase [Nocardia terpenica]ATL71762.1 class IV adenylate cyclase [Nocardia terpenica]